MPDQGKESAGVRVLREVRKGESLPLSETHVQEGYKPSKPSNVSLPQTLPIPPAPQQDKTSQANKEE